MKATATVTAVDEPRFACATLHDVTYSDGAEMDSGVSWHYVYLLVHSRMIKPVVICKNRDGTEAGTIRIQIKR